jgi:phage terminase large subunit
LSELILRKLKEWQSSPLLFVNDCIEVTPSSQQIELLQSVTKSKRISVRSGHGTGKDAAASWIILWFMSTRPYAKVVCTAPTNRQLQDILWSELSKWLRKSKLQDEFIIQRDKLFHKSAPKEWWVRAVSPSVKASKEEQAETLAGFHGDHLLIVVDEASGVPDPVYIPLEGALTQEDNRVMLIGNMTQNSGYFYDTHFHHKIRDKWKTLHWDSRDSSNVSQDMIQYFRDKYGENSNVFAVRVAGDPPSESETTLIPLAWAIQCIGNEIEVAEDEPLYLCVDVARYGEDDSIIMPKKGLRIFPWETHHGLNTIDLGGHINLTYGEMEAEGLAIDEIGVGAGVTDWLHKHGHIKCFGVNVARASSDPKKFDRLRDELWCMVRDKCMTGSYSFPDITVKYGAMDLNLGHELANELSSPTYDFNEQGGIRVESKKKMKLRGIKSPNIADALCLGEHFGLTAYKVWGKKKTKRTTKTWNQLPTYKTSSPSSRPSVDGWMYR